MVRSNKSDFVNELAKKRKVSQSVILADCKGLSVGEFTDLRSRLRKKAVELRVIKNRLGKRALAEAECEALDDVLKGCTVWAFGVDDPVDPAKILAEFAKENKKLVLKGGLLEKRTIDMATISELASLPSRQELLGKMANGLMQPATKLASVMQATTLKLARAFQALADKLEKETGAAETS